MSSSISRLPKSATQFLGSHGVITTPVSLVKELLDNSIDAKATSVEVIVSANSVSKIEVRDNGVGIHPDDYDALGRRSHTSKLRSLEQLRLNASKTLGFRGEALASANCMATVTITTKTSTEPIAALLHISPNTGGVAKQQAVSAPVGTTVSVTDLFGRLPVREQVAIKEARKTLEKFQELLRSYVMARPQLKLSFKVFQIPKYNWSYAANQNATVKEAAIQIFGVDLAGQCFEKTVTVSGLDKEDDSLAKQKPIPQGTSYSFETFMTKPDADPHKISRHIYFSVDGRPLTAKGATIRKLLNIYSKYISIAFQRSSSKIPLNYFIRLNIVCPPGSYDANIEPSKDDVLFSNEKAIINGFKGLCEEIYNPIEVDREGPLLTVPSSSPLQDNMISSTHLTQALKSPSKAGFPEAIAPTISLPMGNQSQLPESLSAHLEDRGLSQENHSSDIKSQKTEPSVFTRTTTSTSARNNPGLAGIPDERPRLVDTTRTGFKVDMSIVHSERAGQTHRQKDHTESSIELQSLQGDLGASDEESPQDLNPWVISKMNAPCKQIQSCNVTTERQRSAPTPSVEPHMTPDLPILRHPKASPTDLDFRLSQHIFKLRSDTTRERPVVPGGPYRSPISSPIENRSQEMSPGNSQNSNMMLRHRRPFPPWSPPSSIERNRNPHGLLANSELRLSKPNEQEPPSQNNIKEMFASARRNLNYQLSRPEERSMRPTAQEPKSQGNHDEGTHNAQPFIQLRSNVFQDDHQAPTDKKPIMTTLADGDPRTYLLRRQKSIAANPRKLRRVKSSLMPLESIPPGDQTHSLTWVTSVSTQVLLASTRRLRRYDRYVTEGSLEDGLEMSIAEGRLVEERIKELLAVLNSEVKGGEGEMQVNFTSLLKGKGVAIET
ncbi:hypothetical protein F5X99DRAFT_411680 [Biscogniauxia marginata]|nr:hypothetical protein F5X99DRAFT_411680 [Biscogniauxia marginata]